MTTPTTEREETAKMIASHQERAPLKIRLVPHFGLFLNCLMQSWHDLLILHQEKKVMVTHNKELLMAFVYFDQSHCGYLLERDLEEILYTLGLHLSRAQVNKTCIRLCPEFVSSCVHPLLVFSYNSSSQFFCYFCMSVVWVILFDISRSRSC